MKKIKYLINFSIILLLFIFLFTRNSYAYLDPGTASMILQAIIGIVAATMTFIVVYWRKIKNYIKNKKLFFKPKK